MPERYPPEDPREWLNRAQSSLILARAEEPGIYLEEYLEALAIAEAVVRWAEERLGKGDPA